MQGGSGCHIVPHSRILYKKKRQYLVRPLAVALYHNLPLPKLPRVTSTCGVTNCINPDHISVNTEVGEPVVTFNNKFKKQKKERLKQKEEAELDKPDYFGYIHDIHPDMWAKMTDEEKSRARKGEFDGVTEGFGVMARKDNPK